MNLSTSGVVSLCDESGGEARVLSDDNAWPLSSVLIDFAFGRRFNMRRKRPNIFVSRFSTVNGAFEGSLEMERELLS